MKKVYSLGILLVICLILVGCGKKPTEPEKTEFTVGDKISIKNFDIEFLNYSLRKAITDREEHQNLVFLEVNATNKSNKAAKFSNSSYKVYGPTNIQLDIISNSKYSSSLSNLGYIRSEGTTNGHLIFEFAGYGKYYLEFVNTSNKKITVTFDITELTE